MSNVVHENNFQPSYDDILRHLQILHGRASSGVIEIAWSPSGDKRALNQAELFDVADLDRAAERAFELNKIAGVNVYTGAALRKPGTFPTARASDEDFHAAWALHVDLDDEGAVERAKAIYTNSDMSPPIVVVTGRKPWVRAQLWWMLEDPITDPDAYRAQLEALAAAFKGDPTVTNPSRVMRVGGSVAWPKKEGRVTERTELHSYRDRRQEYDLAEIAFEFPPMTISAMSTGVDATPHQKPQGPLGLKTLTDDGRERYMRDSVLACAREYVGENGCMPTPEELFEVVWPQYSAKTDFSRGGRGADEVIAKCRHTVRRLEQGRIRGMVSLEQIVDAHRSRKTEDAKAQSKSDEFGDATADHDDGIIAQPLGIIDPSMIPKREWIMENRFVSKFVTLTIAPGGLGKSTLTMQEAIAIAVGKTITGMKVNKPGNVWIFNNEDPMEELHRRIAAICKHHEIPLEDIANKVFLNSGRDRRLIVAKELDGAVVFTPDADALMREIDRLQIRLCVLDPFVRIHQVNENSNDHIDAVAEVFGKIADRTGCAFDLVHHTRKASNGATYTGDADSARGAGSLMGAARVCHTLIGMTDKEAEKFCLKPEDRAWYVRMDDAKANMLAPAERAVWFKRQSVTIDNRTSPIIDDGDSVGVLERWEPPSPSEATRISVETASAILNKISAAWGEQNPYSKSYNSPRYAVKLIREHNIPDYAAKVILATWLENGMVEDREYDQRNGKRGLFVCKFPGKANG